MRHKNSYRAAVLDVGGFSAYLLVVERNLSRKVVAHKVRLRLDEAVDAAGCITADGIDRICEAVRTTERRLRMVRTDAFVPFATSSVRDAGNADEIVDAVARRTGLTLTFLSARKEARLAYQAAWHWTGATGPLTVLDIGGGTVEIAHGDGERPAFAHSLPFGARTLARTGITTANLDKTRAAVLRRIRHALPDDAPTTLAPARVAGCSTVFRSLSTLTHTQPLRRDAVSEWIPRLAAMSPRQRAELRGISPHRARQSLAGAILAEALMTATGHPVLDICPWSTREGVLLGLLSDP